MLGFSHPQWSSVPVFLSFVAPLLALVIGQLIRKEKLKPLFWLVVVIVQVVVTVTSYAALKSGDQMVRDLSLNKVELAEHVSQSEMFIALTVAASTLSVVVLFIQFKLKYPIVLITALLMLIQSGLVTRLKGSSSAEDNSVESTDIKSDFENAPRGTVIDDTDYGDSELDEIDDIEEYEE
jgi:drug/metabolite transporter (DMT)-like permease